MMDFVDISISRSQPENPYLIFLFKGGAVVDVSRHALMDGVVAYCNQHDLPIVSSSPFVREQLLSYGIESRAYETRAVGMAIG